MDQPLLRTHTSIANFASVLLFQGKENVEMGMKENRIDRKRQGKADERNDILYSVTIFHEFKNAKIK